MPDLNALPSDRVDERDTVFARMERRADTAAYDDYYASRPHLQAVDDRLRAQPPLGDPRGRHYDPVLTPEAEGYFEDIERIEPDPDTVAHWAARLSEAADATEVARAMLIELGAVSAGFTALEPAFVYTHKGRFDENYGREIDLPHPHALVFLVEMAHEAVQHAPRAETFVETARQYWRAAVIAQTAQAAIRAAGHDAKAHYDAHYDIILPPLAVLAGLGELGRNNILVADRYGSRVRIGAVTTTLDVRHNRPVSLGVQRFCASCAKCADLCPSRALSAGSFELIRGVAKWPTHVERCYGWWRHAGTDCGLCLATCPFSHPAGGIHAVVRFLVRRAPWLNRILLLLDDIFYDRKRWREPES